MKAEAKGRRIRETRSDPNRAKMLNTSNDNNNSIVAKQNMVMKNAFKKVQVVYYLSRNGQLEHPHYMEVTHLANQHLRLKDVLDRLTVLRGKGMPSLYSWSCKRSYKNGYVWNDLSENDIITSSEGSEYVLKGSELIQGCTEKFQQQVQVTNRSPDPTFHSKRRTTQTERHHEPEFRNKDIIQYECLNTADGDNLAEDQAVSYTSSMTPQQLRCPKGVSTEELAPKSHKITVLTLDNNMSPPSTTSSTASDKAGNEGNNNTSKRFEPDGDSLISRNSILLNLISCGSTSFRAKAVPLVKDPPPPGTSARKSGATDLLKVAMCKAAIESKAGAEEEEMMIRFMSENPRFGNLQVEEKEYFSGSIVEALSEGEVPIALKRSASYNEERSKKAEVAVDNEEEHKREKDGGGVRGGKCIPRIMYNYYSCSKSPKN